MDTINKQPAEKYTVSIDFTGRLPASVTVSSGIVSAIKVSTGETDTSVYSSASLVTTNTTASAILQAGVDGQSYQVTFTVTLSDGSILVEDALLKVRKAKP